MTLARFCSIGLLSFCLPVSWPQSREKRIVPVASPAVRDYQKRARIALVVGVGAYQQGSGLSSLKYAARDAEELARALERQGYMVRLLTDAGASRAMIRQSLRQLDEAMGDQGGLLLFYYSGHGFADKGENYLATFGTTVEDLSAEGLPVREIEATLRASRAKQKVMFIDACRNDPLTDARAGQRRTFTALQAAEGLGLLYSAHDGRVSYENDKLQHGVFTYYLLRGLGGEAAGTDGFVTFRDLVDYTVDTVRRYGVAQGQVQVPFHNAEGTGDFLIATVESSKPPEADGITAGQPGVPIIKTSQRDGQKYVWIAPGRFRRGCSDNDRYCLDIEKPVKEIEITKGFWMGQSEVTVGAWKRYADATGLYMPPEKDEYGRALNGAAGNDSVPVSAITWEEAKGFCGWLDLRLPTEAEWEFAARAGVTQERYGELDSVAWYTDNAGRTPMDGKALLLNDRAGFGKKLAENGNGPRTAGGKQPNANALYDMLGNVWEWTADWFGATYYATSETRDPQGPPGGQYRVLRGGSWATHADGVRFSSRDRQPPEARLSDVGFRCVGAHNP